MCIFDILSDPELASDWFDDLRVPPLLATASATVRAQNHRHEAAPGARRHIYVPFRLARAYECSSVFLKRTKKKKNYQYVPQVLAQKSFEKYLRGH